MGCGASTTASVKQIQDNLQAAVAVPSSSSSKALAPKIQMVESRMEDVRQYYTFDKVLGKGNFGVVHLVYDKKTAEPLACKSISKRKLINEDDIEDVRREIQIMNHLQGHPNITNLIATFEDKFFIHLVMDVCSGGELFEAISRQGHFSEKAAAEALRNIVRVVHHCHTMNVIHRDLKPENFLLSSKEPDAMLKATDFGLSRFFKEGDRMAEVVGSPFYVAPEVLKRSYGKECDIWSCGVILYILLCGWPPFNGDSTQAIFRSVVSAPLDLKSDPWPKISEPAKDLVRKMLTRDPKRRMTAEQVLEHPWMKENGLASDEPFLPEVLVRMRIFSQMNTLKKEALKVMARALPFNEIVGIKEMFEEIDQDGSGCITVDELRAGLRKKGADLALQEVQKIVDCIDINGNNTIDYEEFLAATMHLNKLNREENMIAAFKYFDSDDSGFITRQELQDAMLKIGENIDIDGILADVDHNGDGMIDYEEFCEMMRNNDFDLLKHATKALRTHVVIEPQGVHKSSNNGMNGRGGGSISSQTGSVRSSAHMTPRRGSSKADDSLQTPKTPTGVVLRPSHHQLGSADLSELAPPPGGMLGPSARTSPVRSSV